jgi:hypothetical protein
MSREADDKLRIYDAGSSRALASSLANLGNQKAEELARTN